MVSTVSTKYNKRCWDFFCFSAIVLLPFILSFQKNLEFTNHHPLSREVFSFAGRIWFRSWEEGIWFVILKWNSLQFQIVVTFVNLHPDFHDISNTWESLNFCFILSVASVRKIFIEVNTSEASTEEYTDFVVFCQDKPLWHKPSCAWIPDSKLLGWVRKGW